MRKSVLFRIESDPIGRIWSGVNQIEIPADIVEPEPAIYLGGGNLVNIPDLEQLINGTFGSIEITISGVSQEAHRLAREDAPSVKGARCHIGEVYLDDDWQIDAVQWLGVYRADFLTTARQNASRSVTISISTDDADRSRAPIAFWTQADQHRRSADDNFFDHVAGISSGTSRRFGPSDG